VAFAGAVVAGFFARRPLKLLRSGSRPEQRAKARGAFAILSILAGAAAGVTLAYGGIGALPWFVVMGVLAGAFLYFDLRHEGREGAAELVGAAAFALAPGALAAAAGWGNAVAFALALTMLARALPTVSLVRTCVRAAKGADKSLAVPLAEAAFATVMAVLLARRGLMPWLVPVLLGGLCARAMFLAGWRGAVIRARALGFLELGLGAVYVVAAGLAWRYFANA
jgi:hypothetical protein